MGTLKRIKQIITVNINHLIDEAEDPEKMLKQLIREMDENIISLRMEVAKAIAAEKRLARHISETGVAIKTWQGNSEKAVGQGNDELARGAIARRLSEEKLLVQLQEQHKKALAASEIMKEKLKLLEDKIQEARRKKEVLIARKRSAQAQKKVFEATQDFNSVSGKAESILNNTSPDSTVSLESLEEQVTDMETEAEALNEVLQIQPSVEDKFNEANKKEEIEKILREMKEKIKIK